VADRDKLLEEAQRCRRLARSVLDKIASEALLARALELEARARDAPPGDPITRCAPPGGRTSES